MKRIGIKELKVGDLVKLRKDLKDGESYGAYDYYGRDMKYKGFKKVTYVRKDIGAFYIENKSHGFVDYYYAPEMIAEVRRPTKYETIYKKEEPILDEEEREYLSAIIKPFRYRISFITKCEHISYDEQYLLIGYDKGMAFYLPDFVKNSMYKGMELNKEYTLEELGI